MKLFQDRLFSWVIILWFFLFSAANLTFVMGLDCAKGKQAWWGACHVPNPDSCNLTCAEYVKIDDPDNPGATLIISNECDCDGSYSFVYDNFFEYSNLVNACMVVGESAPCYSLYDCSWSQGVTILRSTWADGSPRQDVPARICESTGQSSPDQTAGIWVTVECNECDQGG